MLAQIYSLAHIVCLTWCSLGLQNSPKKSQLLREAKCTSCRSRYSIETKSRHPRTPLSEKISKLVQLCSNHNSWWRQHLVLVIYTKLCIGPDKYRYFPSTVFRFRGTWTLTDRNVLSWFCQALRSLMSGQSLIYKHSSIQKLHRKAYLRIMSLRMSLDLI